MGRTQRSRGLRHFLYLYRDSRQNLRYVGYAGSLGRAVELRGRKEKFSAFVRKGGYAVEICGPFQTRELAMAAETALISAVRPDCNISRGTTRWRFRPLGVPERFVERLAEPPLTRGELRELSVLLVRINDQDFDDGRPGYDLLNLPQDRHILARMEAWWQLGPKRKKWLLEPRRSPRLLLGVHGAPGSQIIIGAVRINPNAWSKARTQDGLWSVPTISMANLDALGLRGRRIARSAKIRFGQFFSQQYVLLA